MINPRATAALAVHAVAVRHRSLDRELPTEGAGRGLIAELAFGTVRHYFSLRAAVRARLAKPLKERDAIVECLMLVGAYQLRHTRIPPHAAVSETVSAVREIGRPWARGLVNGVLRALARARPEEWSADPDPEARYDQPIWLIEALAREQPDAWQEILRVSNERAPMSLRVNRRRMSRHEYQAALANAGIEARAGMGADALRLETPVPVGRLPGYEQGWVSVMDEGAQLVADLLGGGERVLDACAAPGGKALHLLERRPSLQLTAVEVHSERAAHMRREASRLGFETSFVHEANALEPTWWDGCPFEAILVDAPCTGTGTLRRHPDIKLLKRADDIPRFHALQSRLLASLWPMLAPGGSMLYCTCSILEAENDAVVAELLSRVTDARSGAIAADWGIATAYGRQLLPTSGGPDGYYYARLNKRH